MDVHHSNVSIRLIAKKRTAICGCGRGHHSRYFIIFLADPCHAGLDCKHSLKNILNWQKYLHVLSYIFVLPSLSVYTTTLPWEMCALCYRVIVFLADLSYIRRPPILSVSKYFTVFVYLQLALARIPYCFISDRCRKGLDENIERSVVQLATSR